jgi:AcrR family transcriptional regulator
VKSGSAPYHHGNLREALLEAGLAPAQARCRVAPGLHRAGPPGRHRRTAPYRHFESKEALIAAIAGQGLSAAADLSGRGPAWRQPDDIEAWFLEGGRQSSGFATDNPEHLKVMFGPYITSTWSPAGRPRHSRPRVLRQDWSEAGDEGTASRPGAGRRPGGGLGVGVVRHLHVDSAMLPACRTGSTSSSSGPGRMAAMAEQAAHDALAAVRAPPAAMQGGVDGRQGG